MYLSVLAAPPKTAMDARSPAGASPEDTQAMMKNWLRSHPLLTYYVMVFAISWGSILILAGPGGIVSSSADPTGLTQFVYLAALAGPSIAGIVVTGLMLRREGLHALLAGVLRWWVDARWYLLALLTAPLLMAAIVFMLSLEFPGFVPAIVTTDGRVGLLISGIVLGLAVSFFEEIGRTEFAAAEFRKRHGILPTGLIMGVIWAHGTTCCSREPRRGRFRQRSTSPCFSSPFSFPSGFSWFGSMTAPRASSS